MTSPRHRPPMIRSADGDRICYVCKTRLAQPKSARCNPCIERMLRKKCIDCGETISRRASRCRTCNGRLVRESPIRTGRMVTNKGYVMVHQTIIPPEDRGSPRINARGYILEHVLVMEQQLGRRLRPGENIHHLNGIRDDNRPENLELWLTKQPYGQRVSDLVEWAKEILATYGDESH